MKITAIMIPFCFLAIGCSAQSRESVLRPRAIVTRIDQTPPHPQIVISDAASFTNLLSFFPDMWQEKQTDLAGGWEGKYQIVFQFSGRPEVKVVTSYDNQAWSSGKGDKPLKPGLSTFLDPMFKTEQATLPEKESIQEMARPLAPGGITKDQWFSKDLSADERNEIVASAKKEPFEQIAPMLLKALVDYQPFIGINPWGNTPWNNDRMSPQDRTFLMASAVWKYHMSPKDDLPKAKLILSLLQIASNQAEKSILIGAIMNDQWCPDAEQALLVLCRNTEEPLDVRRRSAETLLCHCDLNVYMPLAVEIILAHKKGLSRCQAFNFTTNQGNRLFSLNEKNRQAVLAAGFDILNELSDEELQTGYFVARRLGFILKIHNEFTPDQKAEKYQDAHGLKDEFFIDTVKNATAWYSKHKKEI